jgi:hypothetical protein
MLSASQRAAATRYPNLERAYLGYRFHQAVAAELRQTFAYSYRGVDFTEIATGVQVELTTTSELLAHQARYGGASNILRYVTYGFPE